MARTNDELTEALDDVVDALEGACAERSDVAAEADAIRGQRRRGLPVGDIVATKQGAIVVHMSGLLSRLNGATTRLRRAQAKAMREEGVTTEKIADVLGVTRQRVSALLRNSDKRAG